MDKKGVITVNLLRLQFVVGGYLSIIMLICSSIDVLTSRDLFAALDGATYLNQPALLKQRLPVYNCDCFTNLFCAKQQISTCLIEIAL